MQSSPERERGRFAFGANWRLLLDDIGERRLQGAVASLQTMLGTPSLEESTFLDVGSGSGLFSAAARRLGARVRSFDLDAESVACTQAVRDRLRPDDPDWVIDSGSILDPDYVARLGAYDIVYSWGVLHHTGAMWQALGNIARLVKPDGKLLISIYNDQGAHSIRWRRTKVLYNRAPSILKHIIVGIAFLRLWGPTLLRDALRGNLLLNWKSYPDTNRGMDPWRDTVDWVGGYPFEVASPEAVFRFFRDRGFRLEELTTCGAGHGCNEFLFSRTALDRGIPLRSTPTTTAAG